MVEVSSSLLNVKDEFLKETVLNLEQAKTDFFHIDVMDGKFVEKENYAKSLKDISIVEQMARTPIDVHLMVEDVEDAVYDFAKYQPNIITFHLEACKDEKEVMKMIDLIKSENSRVGISVKPDTKIEEIYKYLPYIHQVLVMTVEPGKGGQTLITDMIDKVQKLKNYVDENGYEVDIAVDGGVNLATAPRLKKAGANFLIAGNAILLATDYKVIIDELKE